MNPRLAVALSDRYRIERELGQGGMATVYLAEDLKHERQVAIKVLREDLSASLGAGRFLREIKIAAQLQHPHILPLLDSGEADGFLYFVMPYIKGQSLRERLAREGELPVHEAVRLISEVVDALVEAHAHGVVHRDIKPDNVMLSGRHALVTDFGVAKAISEATGRNTVTTLGVAVGTPTYMSPEQAAADPHVDHRSDIYSVGVMAYEMLSGRPPFTGNTPQQVLAAHVTEAPDPVSKRRPAIPAALEQIVMKCLAKRPADRYQTASELHAALEPLSTSSTGMTPTDTRPVAALSRRRRLLGIGLAAAALGAIALYAIGRRDLPRPAAPVPVQLTFSGRAEAPTVSPNGDYILFWDDESACDTVGYCGENLYVQEAKPRGARRLVDSLRGLRPGEWSPDGRRFLISRPEGNHSRLAINAMLGGELVHDVGALANWTASPDSIFLYDRTPVRGSPIWIRIADASTVTPVDSFRFVPAAVVFGITASPDGKWLVIQYRRSDSSRARSLAIASRRGEIIDTLPLLDGWLGWGPRSDRVYLRRNDSNVSEVHRQMITSAGRRSGEPVIVTSVPLSAISVASTSLTYLNQTVTAELFALEWVNGQSQPRRRSVLRTTSDIQVSISDDGGHFDVSERNSPSDRKWIASTIDFNKSEQVPLGSPRIDHAMSYDLSPGDESRALIAERRNGKTILTMFTGPKRDIARELPTTFPDSGYIRLLPHDNSIWFGRSSPKVAVVLDSNGQIKRRLNWPDPLRITGEEKSSPDGSAWALLVLSRLGDTFEQNLYRYSLVDGQYGKVAGPFAGFLLTVAGPWSADGWIPFLRADTSGHRRMIRINMTNGKIIDDGPAPISAPWMQLFYSQDRRRAAAVITTYNSDVMMIRNFDPTAH